jgi:hypothetical protein
MLPPPFLSGRGCHQQLFLCQNGPISEDRYVIYQGVRVTFQVPFNYLSQFITSSGGYHHMRYLSDFFMYPRPHTHTHPGMGGTANKCTRSQPYHSGEGHHLDRDGGLEPIDIVARQSTAMVQ